MVKKYLDGLIEVFERINLDNYNIIFKHFFSGAAAYFEGKIFASLTPIGFAIKLPSLERKQILSQKGTKMLQYFPKAPIKKDYVVLADYMMKDSEFLQKLIQESIKFLNQK